MAAKLNGTFPLKNGLKLTKAERKIIKKQNKALHTIRNKEREVGAISDSPSPYLLVKNGGLICGIKRQDLVDLFQRYGKLDDIIMLSGKSFSYVLYNDSESASKAMSYVNGRKVSLSEKDERKFYLAYLLKRPCLQLYQSDALFPPGMILLDEFISEELENELIQHFSRSSAANCNDLNAITVTGQLKHRYVKHFGYEFIYGSNNVNKDTPLPYGIPNVCLPIIEKLLSLDCIEHKPDQLTVNEYLPGQGIPPHIDTHSAFENGIISISLGAKVAMDFRHEDSRHVSILLPQRSALIMNEECRYAWTHGITPRKYDVVQDNKQSILHENGELHRANFSTPSSTALTLLPRKTRLSLTFRKVRHSPCHCRYAKHCDSQNYGRVKLEIPEISRMDDIQAMEKPLPRSHDDAVNLEKEHVHKVYDNIAEHFSNTRHSAWPKIAEFLKNQPVGSLVADVGCGNGKYLSVNKDLLMFGSDRSGKLATICRERGFHVIIADILSLPYRCNSFDVCVCIAVVHHLSTSVRRRAAIQELIRIVRPGGRILISVWALEQNFDKFNNKKPTVDRDLKQKTSEDNIPSADSSLQLKENEAPLVARYTSIPPSKNTVYYKQNVKSDTSPNIGNGKQHECSYETGATPNTILKTDDVAKTSLPLNCPDPLSTHKIPLRSCDTSSKSQLSLKVNKSKENFEQQDLLIPWRHQIHKKHVKKTPVDGVSLSSFTKDEQLPIIHQRYYHVFKHGELAAECKKLDDITVVRCYYDKGNWCIELEKVASQSK